MSVKLLSKHHLEFLSLKVDCTGSYESTLVKMPHCWKSSHGSYVDVIAEDKTACLKYNVRKCDVVNTFMQLIQKRTHLQIV